MSSFYLQIKYFSLFEFLLLFEGRGDDLTGWWRRRREIAHFGSFVILRAFALLNWFEVGTRLSPAQDLAYQWSVFKKITDVPRRAPIFKYFLKEIAVHVSELLWVSLVTLNSNWGTSTSSTKNLFSLFFQPSRPPPSPNLQFLILQFFRCFALTVFVTNDSLVNLLLFN